MNKSVLIIKGFSKTETELINDRKIIQLYVDFFISNAGGCFEKTEVFVYEDPKLEDIQKLEFLNKRDYLIVLLVGHGATKDGIQIFQLNENTVIQPGQIQFDCKRQLHIIESCRDIFNSEIEIQMLNEFIPKYRFGGLFETKSILTREESLKKYNAALKNSKEGLVFLFACNIDESAEDYFFLKEIISQSVYIHEYYRNSIYGILEIFETVKNRVCKLSEDRQHPIEIANTNFPFVVTIM